MIDALNLIVLIIVAQFVLFGLGLRYGVFGILSGLFGAFVAFKLWELSGDIIVSAAWGAVSIALLIVSIDVSMSESD